MPAPPVGDAAWAPPLRASQGGGAVVASVWRTVSLPASGAVSKPSGDPDEDEDGDHDWGGGIEDIVQQTQDAEEHGSWPGSPASSIRERVEKFVHFEDYPSNRRRRSVASRLRRAKHLAKGCLAAFGAIEIIWRAHIRRFVIATSLVEFWSMGIWVGFLAEPDMAATLLYIAYVDIACNIVHFVDGWVAVIARVLEKFSKSFEKDSHGRHRRRRSGSAKRSSRKSEPKSMRVTPSELDRAIVKTEGRCRSCHACLQSLTRADLKIMGQLALCILMAPIQYLLVELLRTRRYVGWQVALVLGARAVRVLITFRECAHVINQQEMEVYVDISMHGTSDSAGNRARILLKQFLVVIFFGHWFGCLSHAVRKVGGVWQKSVRSDPDYTRDYFEKFQDEAMLDFEAGGIFWQSYLLSVYKGFNLNYEDLLPERPMELAVEVLGSILVLLMKSYCIGSFFKFHQRRDAEVQKFSETMEVVSDYLDLYEMPASLRKVVKAHFRYQQANHRRVKTLQVIGGLPQEVQKKLKTHEVLPIILDRNPTLFGGGITQEYCLAIALKLTPHFLQAGEILFLESEVPRELIFLDTGAISLSRSTKLNGRTTEQMMGYIRADRKEDPTALGATALILGCLRFFSARVRTGAEAVTLNMSKEDFQELNTSLPGQMDLLISNVASMHHLDVQGRDADGTLPETDSETAIREEVRRVLQSRRESMNTALTFAASKGDVKQVKELLRKQVDANTSDYDGRSALHLAATEGMTEVLEALLEASGNPNIKDRWGSTPMQDAVKSHFLQAAKVAQTWGGQLDLADPAGELCTQASEGNIVRMQQLLDFGIDPNAGDYDARTALHLSASEGHLPVVTFLTSRKANVNALDRWHSTPIQDAIRNGFPIVAAHLLKEGGRFDNDFAANQLCDAASAGNISLIETLCMTGTDVNQGDYDQRTALHLSAAEGRVLALDYLVNSAGAMHSPVDRWGSTPLQDAIANGHEICMRVLVAYGGDLGPSATKEQRRLVDESSKQLGFGQRQGFSVYADNTLALRRRVGSKMNMVKQGRARPDIFDTVEATKFNRSVISGCIVRMPTLCEDAFWLTNLLRDFEVRSEPLFHFMRLVRNCDSLAKEARFCEEVAALQAKADAARAEKRTHKDAQDMVFHKALLQCTPYVPGLTAFRNGISSRILERVERLREEQHHGKRVQLGKILAQEVLKELGVLADREEESDLGGVAKAINAQSSAGSALTVEGLAARLEEVSRSMLCGEHLRLSLYHGPLLGQHPGQPSSLQDPGLSARGNNTAMAPLCAWLERRSRNLLAGNAAAESGAALPPRTPATAQLEDVCGSLWPKMEQAQLSSIGRLVVTRSLTWSAAMEPEIAQMLVVASEMALLASVVLVIDGWDRDTELIENDPEARRQQRRLHDELRGSASRVSGQGLGGDRMASEDWLEVGRVCRRAALACRSAPTTDSNRQKALLRQMRRKLKDQKKEAARGEQAEEVEAQAGPLGEEEEEDIESLPIRAAKILAMDKKMSTEELAMLIDVCDGIGDTDETKDAHVFGDVSRERFVLNMLRCITDHDDSQKEVLAQVHLWEEQRMQEAEQQTLREAVKPTFGQVLPNEAELQVLFEDASRMQAEFSDREGDSDEEGGAGGQLALYEFKGAVQQPFDPRRQSMDSAQSPLAEPLTWRRACLNVVFFFFRFCSEEGRKRRQQNRIARRFRELDDDGDGVGTAETAQLLAVAFHHTLGTEGELRYAYRVFELLEKADVGDLVKLDELLRVLPILEEEIKDQQRKSKRASSGDQDGGSSMVTRIASRFVVPADSQFLLVWDRLRTLVVSYYTVEVPIHFCFLSMAGLDGDAKTVWEVLNSACDTFMALNMILTFFRAIVSEAGVVTVFQDIRTHYVFGYFAWDVVACCPIDLWADERNATSQGILARPRATLRLLKLLHMRHLFAKGGDESHGGFYTAAWSMIVFILLLVHFLACIWWLLGTRYDTFDPHLRFNSTAPFSKETWTDTGRRSWLFAYLHGPGEQPIGAIDGSTPFWWQYLISFYWSAGRITNQSSPGNLFAASWVELAWTCVLFLINVAVNGYCDGILVDKVIAGDEAEIEAKSMRKIIEEYVQIVDLPEDLVKEIRASAEQCGRSAARDRMEEMIESLPYSLRQRVATRIFLPRFSTDIFKSCAQAFLVELGAHSRILSFDRGQALGLSGEPADELLVLIEGRIGISGEGGMQLAETSTSGEIIGEMPFIFDLKHVVTITTLEESRVMILTKAAFRKICKLYPQDSMSLKRAAMKMIQDVSSEVMDEEGSATQSKGREHTMQKAKSTLSFATAASARSSSSVGSQSTTVSHALRRMYAGDLHLVVKNLRKEQADAKQDLICNFIQQAADGDIDGVELTLEKGEVAVNEADYDARTALHLAVCNGHIELVKILVEKHHASIHVQDRFRHTPVDDAVREKKIDIVKYLVSRGAKYQVDADVAATLCQAAFDNDLETMRLLLEYVHVDPNLGDYDRRTALHLGASEGHLGVVEFLANLPTIDLSPRDRLGFTPLDDAMRHNQCHVRRFLHQRGATMGDHPMGVVLCDLGAKGDLPEIKEMAESDVNLDEADYDSRTALHLAASNNHLAVVAYLLSDVKLDPNPLDRFLATPLDDAMRYGHKAMCAFLQQRGAMRGSDPAMAQAVAKFKRKRSASEEQRATEKLENEVKRTEVCSVHTKIRALREHLSFENDMLAFTSYASSYRTTLLQLVCDTMRQTEEEAVEEAEDALAQAPLDSSTQTKALRETMLQKLASDADAACVRLLNTLESEVLPWISGLSKSEDMLLRAFVPGLKPAVHRIVDGLKTRARLAKFAQHLWKPSPNHPDGGSYKCLPIGLIMHGFADCNVHDALQRARLEAFALVWASGTGAAMPTHTRKRAGSDGDASEVPGAKAEERSDHKAVAEKRPDVQDSGKDRHRSDADHSRDASEIGYESSALRLMLGSSDAASVAARSARPPASAVRRLL